MENLFDSIIDADLKYDYTLIQTMKNKKPLNIISTAFNRTLDTSIDATDTLKFSVPKYIEDASHVKIENPQYSSIQTENLILLKVGKASEPFSQAYYIIKNVSESTDSLSMDIECISRENSLDKANITIDGIERQLVNNVDNDGILNLIEQQTSWKIGYVQPSCLSDIVNGSAIPRWRWIEALSKPILQFLRGEICTAYNVVMFFDTYNKIIDVYDLDSYGQNTGILLTEENYMKKLGKSTKGDNVCTRLEVSGKDGMTINNLTLDGTNFVSNYDYYISSGQMSAELVSALASFDEVLKAKDIEFKALKTQIDEKNQTLTIRNSELDALEELQLGLNRIQASYMATGNNVNLPEATTKCNNNKVSVTIKKAEIAELVASVVVINNSIAQIAIAIAKTTAKIIGTSTLIFNADLIEELEDWTLTENWSSDVYVTEALLKKASEDILKKYNIPTLEYSMDLVDFFKLKKAQNIWKKIKLGDLARVYSTKIKTNVDLRIVSYSYNIDSNSLSMNFSNKDKKSDDAKGIGSKITRAVVASKYINAKKLEWNQITETKDSVDTFLNNNFELAKQNIQALQGRNKTVIDENGIDVSDVEDPNNVLYMIAGQMVISDDGLQTVKTAINATGIYAEQFIGKMLVSEKLYVENEGGNFSLTEKGFELKDEKYTTLISPKGVVNSDNSSFVDNVDPSNPLVMNFRIDDNVNYINEVMVKLSVENFRADSKSASGGGSSVTTSSSGGASTQTSSGGGSNTITSSGGGTNTITSSSGGSSTQTSTSGGGTTKTSSSDGAGTVTSKSSSAGTFTSTEVGDNTETGATMGHTHDANGVRLQQHAHAISSSHYHTVSISNHTHTVSFSSHSHDVGIPSHTHTTTTPSHTHTTTTPSHTHTTEIPSHSHVITIGEHTHGLVYGIFQKTLTLGTMNVYVDGVWRTSIGSTQNMINLTSFVTVKGWHKIEITSPDLNRFSVALAIKTYIGA